jgi:hypothetical protein
MKKRKITNIEDKDGDILSDTLDLMNDLLKNTKKLIILLQFIIKKLLKFTISFLKDIKVI